MLSMAIFLVVLLLFARFVLPRLMKSIEKNNDRYLPIVVALVFLFFLSWQAGEVHLAPIIGAFAAGLLLQNYDDFASKINQQIAPMAHWMVIFFFVSVGLRVNLRESLTTEVILISTIVIIVALLSKILGAGFGARLAGSKVETSALVGISMAARGEVILIFAALALDLGILSLALYTSLILLVVIGAIIVPVSLKFLINRFNED